jgi:isopenicillin-N epimerase
LGGFRSIVNILRQTQSNFSIDHSFVKLTLEEYEYPLFNLNQMKIENSIYKEDFLLDKSVIFLNHGSFGACPRPVFETYQAWQRQLESQPVEFLGRRAIDLLAEARSELAHYLNVDPDDVVYFANPTTAINMVARCLNLKASDEILATDHEYGAMDRTWRYVCERSGAKYIQQSIPVPVTDKEEFLATFWGGVTPHTKIIFISHITSPTALTFPVAEICQRARNAGLISIVDGAHAPGHIPLDLKAIDADIYTGACHKWLCAPKGAAFLYARRDFQSILEPLVVSWGYQSEKPGPSQFIDYHEWQGTNDLAAFLSVPSAIQYQRDNSWVLVQNRCHVLASRARSEINSLTGLDAISPESRDWYSQMATVRLPSEIDHEIIKERLYNDYLIEVPTYLWQNQPFIRISFQGYNEASDLDKLIEALKEIL